MARETRGRDKNKDIRRIATRATQNLGEFLRNTVFISSVRMRAFY